MVTFILQSLFLIAAAFIIGAVLGHVFKRLSPRKQSMSESSTRAADARLAAQSALVAGNDDVKQSAVEAAAMIPPAEPVAVRAASTRKSPAPQPKMAARNPHQNEKDRPALLKNARRGKPDRLVAIDGIGTAIQARLFALGIFHYDQIAGWSLEQANWISDEIGFAGRAVRENWGKQAAALMKPAAGAKAAPKPAKAAPKPVKATASPKPAAGTSRPGKGA